MARGRRPRNGVSSYASANGSPPPGLTARAPRRRRMRPARYTAPPARLRPDPSPMFPRASGPLPRVVPRTWPRRAAGGILCGIVCGIVAACSGSDGGEGARGDRPRNAILISIDTLRPDHLSCYGYPRATSPHLDRIAGAGVRFTDVTAAAPWTLPSHASMLTGLYPSRHGVKSHETRLPAETVTLAEEFQAAGFQTFAVVNSHNLGAPQFQLGQGFERFEYV